MRITFYDNWRRKHGEKNHLIDLAQNRFYHNKNAISLYGWFLINFNSEETKEVFIEEIQEQLNFSESEVCLAISKLINQNYLILIGQYSTKKSNPCDNLEFYFYEYPLEQEEEKEKNEFTITLKATYIPGYEGLYGLTEDGQVWSEYSNRFLKPQSEGKKTFVKLWKDKKSRDFTIKELKEKVQKTETK